MSARVPGSAAFRATLWRLERAKLDLADSELPAAIQRLAAMRARLVGLLVAEGARLVEEALPPDALPWAR